MTFRSVAWTLALPFLLHTLSASAQLPDPPASPYPGPQTPEEAADYFFLGSDLHYAPTGDSVDTWQLFGDEILFVEGRPDLFLFVDHRLWDDRDSLFTFGFEQVPTNASATRFLIGQPHTPLWRGRISPHEVIVFPDDSPHRFARKYLLSDYQRLVFENEGDLWLAKFDWTDLEITDIRRLTNNGLMDRTTLRHVYDDVLYLWGDLSEENPVVRIDLMTDELTEIEANGVFDPINAAQPNPSGNILFHDRGELAFYNFDDGSGGSLPSTHELEGGGHTAVMNGNGIAWLGADSFLSVYTFYVFRVDFSQPAVDVLYESENSTTGAILNLLPGMEAIDIYKYVNPHGEPQPRFLVDLSDGSETTLPFTSEEEGVWLTDELYIYRRNSGGLSQVGTWIYNRSNGDNRRVCQTPMSLHIPTSGLARRSPNSAYYYEPGGRIYFLSDTGQIRGFQVDVTEGQCVEVDDFAGKSLPFVPFDSRYVDLGLATSGTGSAAPAIPDVHDVVLEPPAPNPARNAATIHFETSVGGPVGITIFDVLGRRVDERELHVAAPGRRAEVIDVTSLPSGLYFLQLQIGSRKKTTTMTVLR